MRLSLLIRFSKVSGLRFLIGTLVFAVVICFSSLEQIIRLYRDPLLQQCGYHLEFLLGSLGKNTIAPFIPIVSVLPFSGNYVDEIKSKFARFCILRTGYSRYLFTQIMSCFLLGGFVILTGILIAYSFCALAFLPIEKASSSEPLQFSKLVVQCLLFFINGSLWAVLGMAMSTFMESKYIAYVSPFVIFYLLVILCERYFPDAYLLYPLNWTNPEVWPYGTWSVAMFLLELTLTLSILFIIRAGRRLQGL